MGSTTRIDKGLRLAQKKMFELENGGRPGVAKILFLLTDGSQTQDRGQKIQWPSQTSCVLWMLPLLA